MLQLKQEHINGTLLSPVDAAAANAKAERVLTRAGRGGEGVTPWTVAARQTAEGESEVERKVLQQVASALAVKLDED